MDAAFGRGSVSLRKRLSVEDSEVINRSVIADFSCSFKVNFDKHNACERIDTRDGSINHSFLKLTGKNTTEGK